MSRSMPQRPPGISTSGASYQSVATFDDSPQVNQRPAPLRGSQHAPRQHNLSGDFGGYENLGSTIPLHTISTQSSSSSRQSYGQVPLGVSSPLTPKPGAWAQTNTAYDESGRERKVSFPIAHSPSASKLSDPFDPYSTTYPSSFTVGTPATPGPAFPQATPLKKPRRHPFSKRYEAPDWGRVFRHFVLCGLAYPILLGFVIAANGKTITTSRLIIGLGCAILGFFLGGNLLALARYIIEAVTWATLIHQSRVPNDPGIRLAELQTHMDDFRSAKNALKLLWKRRGYSGADIEHRRTYDSRRWTPYIVFFLANVLLTSLLTFIFGRMVFIDVRVAHQASEYYEVPVHGALSEQDLARATEYQQYFENYAITWTLSPFSMHGGVPPAVTFDWQGDRVFFSEVSTPELLANGSGYGTFDEETTAPWIAAVTAANEKAGTPQQNLTFDVQPGTMLRYPRWGIRLHCAKTPEPAVHILPRSENGFSYMFTPRENLRELFATFNLTLPESMEAPMNTSTALYGNDTLPAGLALDSIGLSARFWDNGVAHSSFSRPISLGQEGTGFVTVENIFIRLNSTFAPNGTFGAQSPRLPDGSFVGYDAATCVELFEPWVVEVYNSSVSTPVMSRIIGKAAEIMDLGKEKRRGDPLTVEEHPHLMRALNSTGYLPAYVIAHQNSVNQVLKDNSRDASHVPSPSLVSFTNGTGPLGFTTLSADMYAMARGLADATNMLPYFSGSGQVLARQYHDRLMTETSISLETMIPIIVVVFIMGMLSAFFVPKLPLETPRRGFDLYSWMTAFYAHELVAERSSGISKGFTLDEIHDRLGDVKFQYVG